MLNRNHESRIPNVDSELEKAESQKDRKRIKLLLNNLWWQIKNELGGISFQSRMEISALFDRYGESSHFREISEMVFHGGKPNPNRIVETMRTGKLVKGGDGMRFAFSDRMVHRANGKIETIKDGDE